MWKKVKCIGQKLLVGALALASALTLAGCGDTKSDNVQVRVGSLKGPTSLGMLQMMEEAAGQEAPQYTFQIEGTADALTGPLIQGELDIALVPANVASVLYNKTEGQVCVIDINTLGVLYVVSADATISSVQDLKGRTILLTGKGTTPDYVLQYLLQQNGISLDEIQLEYKTEATEVAAYLAEDAAAVGVLPQPYVTAVQMQNENMEARLNLTAEWDAVSAGGSKLVTGVTVVRKAFLEEHPEAVKQFLAAHDKSSNWVKENVAEAAPIAVAYEIVAKEPIAVKAIPQCNLVCIQGKEMKEALQGYLQVLFTMDPACVGGRMPADNFYYE